jgi:Ca-activated chloride channel family protein
MKKGFRIFFRTALWLAVVTLSAAGPSFAQGRAQRSNDAAPGAGAPIAICTQLVSLTVTVTDDRGRYIPGLDKANFSVFEDGVAQEISFFQADDGPATVGVVFDLSGSMNGAKIVRAKEALARFFQTGHRDDDYSLIGFDGGTRLRIEGTGEVEGMLDGVSRISPRGATALYDAISSGLEQVMRGRWGKRAIIVISDGQDNHSRISPKALKRTIGESGAIVYAVLIKDLLPFHQGDELRALAETSGGLAFSPSSSDQMAEAFERIAVDLRRRYSIGYAPSNFSADDHWRRLKVIVTPPLSAPHLIVTSRKGYFATSGLKTRQAKTISLATGAP